MVVEEASITAARRLLGQPGETEGVDRVASLAASLLDTPSSHVCLATDGPAADSLCLATVRVGGPLVVPDARADRRVRDLDPVRSGRVGSCLGVPVRTHDGVVVGALCVFGPQVRAWTADDVAIMESLAASAHAELELLARGREVEAVQARADLIARAGDLAWLDWDIVADRLLYDDRLPVLYGYSEGDPEWDGSIEALRRRVHPDDVDRLAAAFHETSVAGPLHVSYRVVLPDGRVRWLASRNRVVPGPMGTPGHLIGVTWDVTAEREDLSRADQVLSAMTVGYVLLDHGWRYRYLNDEASRLLGREPEELLGRSQWESYPDVLDTVFEETYRRVVDTGRAETFEAYYPAPLNAWYEVRAVPEPDGLGIYFLDVSEQHRTVDLLRLSVDVAERLVGGVSVDDAVAALARRVVPVLADWSIVTLVEAAGQVRDVECWHQDPGLRALAHRFAAYRHEGGGSGAIQHAIVTGTAQIARSGMVEFGLRTLPSREARETLVELAPESAVGMPMVSGGRVVGVLSLFRGAGRPPMDARELAVLDSVCRRAALAVDNARLRVAEGEAAARDRTVAQALQTALLGNLPRPSALRLSARYLTAEDGDQVGGDWYDAVLQPDGATVVIVGDVVGHDIDAAATMGQVRTMLRMVALQHASPAAMLAALDHAVDRLDLGALATVVVARIEAADDGRKHLVRWCNAGHPPPMVLDAQGRARLLSEDESDLMIGVLPDVLRTDHVAVLAPDTTLVLYTDGLVERRGEDLSTGIDRLRTALARHHDRDLEVLLDRVLAAHVTDGPSDDIAVLAVALSGTGEDPGQ